MAYIATNISLGFLSILLAYEDENQIEPVLGGLGKFL